ncbi:class I SAM-dependent methyltransferase [Nocardioides KLBMP 9356]|uniref:Class I SAM-dependent methyltransferase n=1 Tax=Nocardioides potassii TaxID=2911371 RepID=A0ABS9HBZ7_9ACTN|nr:methyltransferase domain-containing protein [Nocardioides potassii]MCF6378024.1 class I SAM-dependent methyltransferase [Nocardioides potassii]
MIEQSFSEVFASALGGAHTVVVGIGDEPVVLPVHLWSRAADAHDHTLVALCDGPTLDIGCGPGRLTEALAAHGHLTLGIDVVAAAVAMTVDRGVPALQRDVFDPLPGEGRWHTALLADGNIGIGGDPVRLLRRVRSLVVPGGRVVVELDGPGAAVVQCWASLQASGRRSRPFRWATLGVDGIAHAAATAGLRVVDTHRLGERWAAVLSEAVA